MEQREEHLEWCKERAREYLNTGDETNAWASFASDMKKHPETANHSALELGMTLLMTDNMKDMRGFIEGFN